MANLRLHRGISGGLWLMTCLAALLLSTPLFGQGPALWAPAAQPQTQPQKELVVQVQVVGNRSVPLQKILPSIRTREGRPFDEEQVEEDVRRLNYTRMFIDVKTYTRQVPGGRVVVFEVLERPTLQEIVFVGNKQIKDSVLKKQVDLKAGDAMDPFAVEEARGEIEQFYHDRGFSKVRVTVAEGNDPSHRRAVFTVNEGQKQKVLWVKFIGNTIASDARLRTQIESKPPILYLFKGEVDKDKIDGDVERLTAYYRSLGFFRARVGREIEYNRNGTWATVTFVIDEGPRYSVRNVSFIGNKKFSAEELADQVELKGNQPFDQKAMNRDVATIRDKYGTVGYIFADVQADPRFLDQPGTLDLVYNVSEGDRYRVGRINVEIKGDYPHTRISTVLNRVSLKPGDIVDIRKIRASEQRLRGSGLFEVDPSRGTPPAIVFTPPEMEADRETVAERPERGSGAGSQPPRYRGQSPDLVPCGPWRFSRSPDSRPGDPRVDLTLPCAPAGQAYPQQQPGAPIPAAVQPSYVAPPQPAYPPAADYGYRPVHTSAYAQSPPPAGRQQEMIVRGQIGYSPDGGVSVPQPRSQPAWSTTVPQTPPYGNQYAPPSYPPTQPAPTAGYGAPYTQPGYQPTQPAPTAGSGTPYAQPGYQPPPTQPMTAQPMPAQPMPSQPMPTQPGGAVPANPPYTQSPIGPEMPRTDQLGEPSELPPLFSPDSPFITQPGDEEFTRPLPLRIMAEETQTGRFMFGVGINSEAGLVGSIIIDEQNFDFFRSPTGWADIRNATAWRGAGQRLRIEAIPGTEVARYSATLQEPYLFNTDVSMSLSGFFYDRRFREYDEQRLGGRASLGYHFTHLLSGSLAFRGAKINIHDPVYPGVPDLDEVVGDNSLYGFGATLTHDTRDSAFLATEGHLIEASVEQVIGTYEYTRGEVDLRQYFLLHQRPDGSGRHVLSLLGRVGITGDDTPLYDHFYAGGFSTIRGFDFRGASPVDISTGIPVQVGGHFMVLGSAEYMFPLTADDMLRAVVFCDTGTVEKSIDDWEDKYRVAPGFGLRITVPAMGPAPIALDFAFPVSSSKFDREEVFSFFLGMLR